MRPHLKMVVGSLLWIYVSTAYSQNIRVHQYAENTDSTVYNALHKIFNANAPVSYISFVRQNTTLDHVVPLEASEGKNGTLAEASVNLSYTFRRGRDYTNNFGQSARLTVDYFSQIRIVKTNSSPILPPTNGFGIGVDWAIADNFRDRSQFLDCGQDCSKWLFGKCCFDARNFIDYMRTSTKAFKALTLHFKAHHYSNGQDEGFFFSSAGRTRHDYDSGDFSTNYLRLILMRHLLWNRGNLLSYSLGYQREFGGSTGFLKFVPEMENSYGKSRILGYVQFRSHPLKLNTRKQKSIDCRSANCDEYQLKTLWEYRLQINASYITDDVSNWRLGNYDRPHRLGLHLIAQVSSIRQRTIGFLLHYYHGRDYLNIRFDNVINSFQIGLTLSLDKYRPFIQDYNLIGRE